MAVSADRPTQAVSFVWTRVGSFLALLPLGIWTVGHLVDNLSAYLGGEAWQISVTRYRSPLTQLFIYTLVLLPLMLHTVWGVQRLFSFKPNNLRYPTYENLKFILQRASAVGLLLFLGAHLWLAMLRPRLVQGHAEGFEDIAREIRWHGPTTWVYVLGTLAVSYHLANGLFGFVWTWGLTSGRRAFARMDRLALIAFVLMLGLSWGAVYGLWRAGEALGR